MKIAMVMEQTLGHRTHYLNLRSYLEKCLDCEIDWVEIPYVTTGWRKRIPLWNHWSVNASLRARKRLREYAPTQLDLVFFHTQTTSLFSCGLMRRLPAVVSLDATPSNLERLGLSHFNHRKTSDRPFELAKRYVNGRTKSFLNERAYHSAQAMVAWTHWVKNSLVHDYGITAEKVHVIPPGVDFSTWRISRIPFGTSEKRPVRILFVGGDFVRKGGYVLLQAWRQTLRDRTELHLVTNMALPPEAGVYVHRGLKPNTPELRKLFAEADIFAFPTFADTFGIVLAEASASMLPIVTTDVGGISDIVVEGETGFVCHSGDVEAIGKALARLVDDAQLREQMGQKAFAHAKQNFDSQKNAERLIQVFAQCLSQTARVDSDARPPHDLELVAH